LSESIILNAFLNFPRLWFILKTLLTTALKILIGLFDFSIKSCFGKLKSMQGMASVMKYFLAFVASSYKSSQILNKFFNVDLF